MFDVLHNKSTFTAQRAHSWKEFSRDDNKSAQNGNENAFENLKKKIKIWTLTTWHTQ